MALTPRWGWIHAVTPVVTASSHSAYVRRGLCHNDRAGTSWDAVPHQDCGSLASRLFAAGDNQDDTPGFLQLCCQSTDCRHECGHAGLHVTRAASVKSAIENLAAEWIFGTKGSARVELCPSGR